MPAIHKLSAKNCETAKPADKPYKLNDGNGLFLLIMPNGKCYWRYRYSLHGKQNQVGIGPYPLIGLAEARERHKAVWRQVVDGIDPAAKNKEQKQLRRECPANTFKEYALEWHGRKKTTWSPRHAFNIMSRLENDIFPEFGDVSIENIKPSHIVRLIERVNSRGAYDIARRTVNYCSQVFNYAISLDKITFNPAANRRDAFMPRPVNHFASITSEDLPEFLAKLDHFETPILPQTRLATRLLMLTFVRTKELVEAPWSEINFDSKRWVIPAGRMKKRRDHIVPLSTQAIEILRKLKEMAENSPYLFPNRSHLHKTMSNATILGGLKRMGYKGLMTGHGFRALAATTLRETLRKPRDVIDLQLAHKPIDKSNPYDRSLFLEERTDLMQDWADYLDVIASRQTKSHEPASPSTFVAEPTSKAA